MLTCWLIALGKRIPDIAGETDAQWDVVAHLTLRIHTTQAGTRILALAPDTSLVLWTIRVDHTFWTAVGRRADHFWQARTVTTVAVDSWWVAVGSTRVGVAGIVINHWFNG